MLIESFLADALLEVAKGKTTVKKKASSGDRAKARKAGKVARKKAEKGSSYSKGEAKEARAKYKKLVGKKKGPKLGDGKRSKAIMKYAKAAGARSPKAVFGAIMNKMKKGNRAGSPVQKRAAQHRNYYAAKRGD